MHAPHARFRLTDDRVVTVQAGGMLGRLATATLRIDDARVSEAHALLSLRGDALWLLALRGGLEAEGKPVRELRLSPGISVKLAEGVTLRVEAVFVPDQLLALEVDGRHYPLRGEVMSWLDGELVPRFVEDTPLRLWTNGVGWRAQQAGRSFEARSGLSFELEGDAATFVTLSAGSLNAPTTKGGLEAPLEVRTTLDELRVASPGRPTLLVGGIPARIVRDLAEFSEPVPWEMVAEPILGPDDELGLRSRWDRNLKTLRRKLESHGMRNDLVRSDGHGKVSLNIGPADSLDVV